MSDAAPKYRRRLSLVGKLGVFAASWLALLYSGAPIQRQADRLHEWWWSGYSWPSGSAAHRVIDLLGHGFMGFFGAAVLTAFLVVVVFVPIGLVLRTAARARLRAGNPDPIAPLRRWVLAHPVWVRVLTPMLPALWALPIVRQLVGTWTNSYDPSLGSEALQLNSAFGIVGVLATVALTGVVRSGLRAFVEPLDDDEAPQRAEVPKDEITFDAVAVTRETRAAILAMMALNVGALALALSSQRAFQDPRVVAGLVAYAAVALGGAALFRHASQVAVGVDGVLVKGTSRTRFYPYRDLDAARVDGGDLELVRRDKVVLRLQLHGEDASKRTAVLARIRAAIDQVKEGRGAVSAQLVSSASAEQLVRAAGGAADYRGAALTREQLWALVEGPEIEENARRAAAEALASTSGPEEKARLRVAAEHCAAPSVRVAIEKLVARDRAAVLEDIADASASGAPHARRSA